MDNQNMPTSTGNSQEKKQTACPVFVGRFTMGLAMIAAGLLVTASLFIPQIPFLTIVKIAPLILVVLGIEILIGAARHQGQNIKVGFWLTLFCLILVFGAVGAGILPEVWDAYGPGHWEEQERLSEQAKQDFYTQIDSTTVEQLHLYLDDKGHITHVNLDFAEDFTSGEQFAAAAADAVHVLADMNCSNASIGGQNGKERWSVSLDGVYSQGEITPQRVLEVMNTEVYSDSIQEE